MELPPASTAPKAIRGLATIVRAGVEYGRTERARAAAGHWTGELRRLYEEAPEDEFSIPIYGKRPVDPCKPYSVPGREAKSFDAPFVVDRLVARGRRPGRVTFPEPADVELPSTWRAGVYERIGWPPEEVPSGRHRFRLFVDFARGEHRFTIPLHDDREPWGGPDHVLRAPFDPPFEPGVPFRSYLVLSPRLTDHWLHRWLVLYLAQRCLLTAEEESCCLSAFYAGGPRESRSTTLGAYLRAKRKFHFPLAGRACFPAYFSRTMRALDVDERYAEQEDAESLSASGDYRNTSLGNHVSLSRLRRSEPKLHRAILDRIKHKTVTTIEHHGTVYVPINEANKVENQRLLNAAVRHSIQFPGRRQEWIRRLVARGACKAAARRKIARWINKDHLSEAEIEASVTAGHRVRLPRPPEPTDPS